MPAIGSAGEKGVEHYVGLVLLPRDVITRQQRGETVTSGINTITNFIPIGSYGKFASIGEKPLNVGQFNALMKGNGITAATNAGIELRLYNFTVRESNNISSFWNYFGTTSTISTYLSTSN